MNNEMNALEIIGRWEIVEGPGDKRPTKCRWIYNLKYQPDGTWDWYKARLVAKGYTQTYGVTSI